MAARVRFAVFFALTTMGCLGEDNEVTETPALDSATEGATGDATPGDTTLEETTADAGDDSTLPPDDTASTDSTVAADTTLATDSVATDSVATDSTLVDVATEVAVDSAVADVLDDAPADVAPFDCVGKPAGTDCGGGNICLKDTCVPSTCGDGYVNAKTGEDCEDGNTVSGDGCSDCKFDCKLDTDCDDKNDCTSNTCDKSTAGKQLCKSAAIEPGPVCKTAAAEAGICKGTVCVKSGCGNSIKEGTEDCDDGNTNPADGCKNDCTFSCKADTDCDDADACNGAETCNTVSHTCVAGTPVSCAAKGCKIAGTCDPASGKCSYPDNDKDGVGCNSDCNDADPEIFPGAPECKDGKDNNCNGLTEDNVDCTCYADPDGDGYATTTAATVFTATCPALYTRRAPVDATSIDCRESNINVNPGVGADATKWFQTAYCAGLPKACALGSSLSFDYDCDKVEEPRWTAVAGTKLGCALMADAKTCAVATGWIGAAPACGVAGKYRACRFSLATGCSGTEVDRTQECK